ncbi:MAG TPA: hypothetical protein VIF40_15570 [Methylosinus sp.]|jgi:hypothetical protein|uniref:hypothetical protein n=1 Tax=Methylosinus sp. TaxID=427 RepID=UPI002F95AF92
MAMSCARIETPNTKTRRAADVSTRRRISQADSSVKRSDSATTAIAAALAHPTGSAIAAAAPSVSEKLQDEGPAETTSPVTRARPRRIAAATATSLRKPVARSADYGARIRSIDVNGQHFDLGNGGRNNAPAPKAQS